MITVVGYAGGPLPEPARAVLAGAGLVAGGRRHLQAVPVPDGARRLELGDVAAAAAELAAYAGDAVVVASGDPGFFGIVRTLRQHGVAPTVLPAVGAVAAAFARLGLPWDDAVVVSAHGRPLRRAANACRAFPKVAVLTAPGAGPAELARALPGWSRRLVVAEHLGEPAERLTAGSPEELAGRRWAEPNVVLCLDERRPGPAEVWTDQVAVPPAGWALPDAGFAHRDGMLTKREVRAVVLARLAPTLGDLVWDVGAGSGAVGVECARFGAAVVAVERDGVDLVRRNADAHGVDVRAVAGVAPAALADLPDPDAVFVGGGGPEVLAACLARGPRRVVVALAAVDRVPPVQRLLAAAGYPTDGVLLQASRLADLPDGAVRLAATNPVFVLGGQR